MIVGPEQWGRFHRVVFNGKVANIAVGVKEAVCVKLGHNLH